MRLYWVIPAILACGCFAHETIPIISTAYARHVVEEAWGEDFDSGTYDVSRELSREERDEVEHLVEEKGSGRGHAGPRSAGFGVSPEGVISEVTLLQPGCALAFCAANPLQDWRATRRRSFVVLTSESLRQLRSERVVAVSPEQAIARSKRPPESEPGSSP